MIRIDDKKITRVEVIGKKRDYVRWNCKVHMDVQDEGRTLKVFVFDKDDIDYQLITNPHMQKRMKEIGKGTKSRAGKFMTKIRQGDVSHKETVAWIKKEQKLLKKSAMSERK